MGYDYDSSKLKDTTLRCYKPESLTETEDKDISSLNVFQKTLPKTDGEKSKIADIDIDALVKKYKKNPFDAIKEIGIDFNEKEQEELKSFITSKKSLKSFLTLIKKNEALKPGDIMSAMRNVKKYVPKNVFQRFGNVIKTTFTDGITEAVKLAKSETVYYADNLGKNMNEIRAERVDFSSDSLADLGDTCTLIPEAKENVMHFVVKSSKDGSKLYTENDVLKARNVIVENIDDANEFTANAVELESIQDKNGNIRYKGSTIVEVGEKMIQNKEVQPTMMLVAKKSDMDDKNLRTITFNIAQNHDMAEPIEYMCSAKSAKGDTFTANQMGTESTFLVDKPKQFCHSFSENMQEVAAKNPKLTGSNILSISHDITNYPEIREQVLQKVQSGELSGTEIERYSRDCAYTAKTNQSGNTKTVSRSADSSSAQGDFQNQSPSNQNTNVQTVQSAEVSQNASNPIVSSDKKYVKLNTAAANALNITQPVSAEADKPIVQKAVINGETYERSEVLRELRKKFGVSAEKVLNRIESDASFIEVMKQYNGNKTIIAALVDDPYLITKIKKAAGSVSVNELADIVKLCTDSASTQVMIEALQSSSPQEAMRITKQSKIFNLKDDTMDILASSNSIVSKKQKISELYLNGGKKKELVG